MVDRSSSIPTGRRRSGPSPANAEFPMSFPAKCSRSLRVRCPCSYAQRYRPGLTCRQRTTPNDNAVLHNGGARVRRTVLFSVLAHPRKPLNAIGRHGLRPRRRRRRRPPPPPRSSMTRKRDYTLFVAGCPVFNGLRGSHAHKTRIVQRQLLHFSQTRNPALRCRPIASSSTAKSSGGRVFNTYKNRRRYNTHRRRLVTTRGNSLSGKSMNTPLILV